MIETNYGDVGANTAWASVIRTTNTRKEFKVIRDKLNNPVVSDGKKAKYLYRLTILQQKFPHIVSDLILDIPATSGIPKIAY